MAFGIPTDPRAQRLVFIGFLGVASALYYWYGQFEPKRLTMKETLIRLDTLDSLNRDAKKFIAKGSTAKITSTTERNRVDLARLRVLVPVGNEVSALLDQISNSARRAHLDVGPFEPEQVIEGELFDTHRYRMRLTGSFHDIAEALTGIGSLPRIVAPVNLSLTLAANQPNAKPTPGRQMLVATFEIQTAVVRTAPPKVKLKPKKIVPVEAAPAKKEGGGA